MKRIISVCLSMFVVLTLAVSVAKAAPLTADMCKDRVDKAVELFTKEGPAAYVKLGDPNGEFRFGDGAGYVWVHEIDTTVMTFHPIKEALVGRALVDLKDSTGKYFFVAFNEMVEKNGSGWVLYQWPKPGESTTSQKASYVAKAVYEGVEYVIGSGVYDVTAEDIRSKYPDDVIDEE